MRIERTLKLRPRGSASYITSPPLLPELPYRLTLPDGTTIKTSKALPIARATLLAAVEALKQIPGGAKRTQYNLERSLFHLKRVTIAPDD